MVPVGMLALAFTAATGVMISGASDPSGGGLYVDLLNVQWWQALIAGAVGLGLSPAPWITALATGRLLFRADFERQLAKKDEEHSRAMAQQVSYYEGLRELDKERFDELKLTNAANAAAAQTERRRADEVTDAVLEVGDVVKANTHVLNSFHAAADRIREERES